jgi:hypothetical protein
MTHILVILTGGYYGLAEAYLARHYVSCKLKSYVGGLLLCKVVKLSADLIGCVP